MKMLYLFPWECHLSVSKCLHFKSEPLQLDESWYLHYAFLRRIFHWSLFPVLFACYYASIFEDIGIKV
jgi:hypothetical protein